MSQTKPLTSGLVFSITVGLGYTICAIAFALSPSLAVGFTTNLFHGLNFSTMQSGVGGFSFGSYFSALIVMMAWAFAMGAIYSSIYNRLTRQSDEGTTSYSSSKVSPSRA